MMHLLLILVILLGIYFAFKTIWTKNSWKTPKKLFPKDWRIILIQNIQFYNALTKEEQKHFEFKIQEFLLNCRVTGIKTEVTLTDKILIASSAIIPIFAFKNWTYSNLQEVLLYPNRFNEKFETAGSERQILGMVGTGYMNGKMILSKKALHLGFLNSSDKKNTAIHEFIHLIDKMDGSTDGIPHNLTDKQFTIPWLELIQRKMDEIHNDKSDINPYGGTSRKEFFAVVSEYFFERPQLLARKHPELYEALESIFNQKMTHKKSGMTSIKLSRNSPCPCNSGLKFKKCCGKIHHK
ncbi:MAG: zinc-dependent peptidase [Flavobacteriales bacterium]|nr:zinc-dependent peptidase [Flavobacteriales bacterium]